jgi:hypothetical protein
VGAAPHRPERVMRWWLMGVDGPWRCRYVPAERPCWKGEIQIGPFVFGWATRLVAGDIFTIEGVYAVNPHEEAIPMAVAKFRKKPIVIEAVRYTSETYGDVLAWLGPAGELSPNGVLLAIHTDSGVMTAAPGDWILKGTKGEFYPCKADIFAEIYESAEPDEPPAWKKPGDSVA